MKLAGNYSQDRNKINLLKEIYNEAYQKSINEYGDYNADLLAAKAVREYLEKK